MSERWDVFHGDRLEVERGLTTEEVRAALARGGLRDDDLIRPTGTEAAWAPLLDLPAFASPPSPQPPPIAPTDRPAAPGPRDEAEFDLEDGGFLDEEEVDDAWEEEGEGSAWPRDDDPTRDEWAGARVARPATTEDLDPLAIFDPAYPDRDLDLDLDREASSKVALPLGPDDRPEPPEAWAEGRDEGDEFDPLEEDEEIAEFTLARGSADRIEELDLAAMVDVAFQMVLFFMVTATTVLYKTLEVPPPNPDRPPGAVAQGTGRTLDDLQRDYILVEIDPSGAIRIDHEPVRADMATLVERLRAARDQTHRMALLLQADFATPHRHAVLAYDAANEIGLRIAIARPRPPG